MGIRQINPYLDVKFIQCVNAGMEASLVNTSEGLLQGLRIEAARRHIRGDNFSQNISGVDQSFFQRFQIARAQVIGDPANQSSEPQYHQ